MWTSLWNSDALAWIWYSFLFVITWRFYPWIVFLEGLPHSQEVVVKYVDFGSVANVTLKDIRKAEDEILSFPVKVI